MRILLKTILFPITLALNIVLGFLKFVLVFGGGLLGILAFLLFIIGVATMITMDFNQSIPVFIVGYLISPYGLPMLGIWIIVKMESFNYWLKSV